MAQCKLSAWLIPCPKGSYGVALTLSGCHTNEVTLRFVPEDGRRMRPLKRDDERIVTIDASASALGSSSTARPQATLAPVSGRASAPDDRRRPGTPSPVRNH